MFISTMSLHKKGPAVENIHGCLSYLEKDFSLAYHVHAGVDFQCIIYAPFCST